MVSTKLPPRSYLAPVSFPCVCSSILIRTCFSQANTNAGGKLRQVAFDAAVMRHLGSSLYHESA